MWRIKRRRTKPKENKAKTGVIYPKFNATAKPNRYVNRNTYLDVKCNRDKGAGCTIVGCQCSTDASGNTYCCKTNPYRNPILGYRKHLLDCFGNTDNSGCGYTNDVSGNVYKDNYAKTCGDPANSLVCYNPVIKRTQNRNGCVNESYNYSTNQYLTRRCLTFSQQEFNFQSQVPVDASGCCTKFMSCANCQYTTTLNQTQIIVSAAKGDNTLLYTKDGINWVGLGTNVFGEQANVVKNNGTIWVAGGLHSTGLGIPHTLAYSYDGLIWVGNNGSVHSQECYDIAYSSDYWLAIGKVQSTGSLYSLVGSTDGKTWSEITIVSPTPFFDSTRFTPNGIAYGGGKWVLFGTNAVTPAQNIYYSTDNGVNWTVASISAPGFTIRAIRGYYNGSLWVAVGQGTRRLAWSPNGVIWINATGDDFDGLGGTDVFYNGGLWVASGGGGGGDNKLLYSTDGKNWSAGTFSSSAPHIVNSVTYGKLGPWVAGSGDTEYYYSSDGKTWADSNGVDVTEAGYMDSAITSSSISPYKCTCSTTGFCTGINKLPCEVKNTKCFAIYKRSNSKFNKQGAVSGGSRINRLKYQTRVVAAQRRKANGRNNVINRRGPAALYTTSRPPQMNAPGCWLNKDRTRSGLAQRCIVTDPCCCPTTSGDVGACCDETLPEGVIKLCTAGNPGCDDCPGGYDYEMVGYLNDPQYPDWAGHSGCDPSCGRLGQLPYPTLLGTICPPDASYNNTTTTTTTTIGGFAWNFNESERHLWFFLQTAHGFNVDGTNATGFQFTSVEFSSSSAFLPANTVKLYGRELDIDYKSNTEYEVHWSGEDGLTNWNSATITKIDDIFGTALNANKKVYIKFDLDSSELEVIPGGFGAIPGASPSYIIIVYNESLGPAPSKENFSAINVSQGSTLMDISAIDIITTSITNDTVRIELSPTAIAGDDLINLSYSTTVGNFIINSTGAQLAPIFSSQSIVASGEIIDLNFINLVDIWLDGGTPKIMLIATYGTINTWDVSGVTDMTETFSKDRNSNAEWFGEQINEDISGWNTKSVLDMSLMFQKNTKFNYDISSWNTELVADMNHMFAHQSIFNHDISDWDTGEVLNMSGMFSQAVFNNGLVNNPLSWNTIKVTNMNNMFSNNAQFDQYIGSWNVSNVTNMSFMFHNATSFNQDLPLWDLSSITDANSLENCFFGASQLSQSWASASWYSKVFEQTPQIAPAFYSDGSDGWSPGVTSQPEILPPPEVINDLNATNITDITARLNWTPPISISTITGYDISGGTAPGVWNSITLPTPATDNSYNVTGLAGATTYYFNIRAINAVGPALSPGSNLVTVETNHSFTDTSSNVGTSSGWAHPTITSDVYGNLYTAYFTGSSPGELIIKKSIDEGATWDISFNFSNNDPTSAGVPTSRGWANRMDIAAAGGNGVDISANADIYVAYGNTQSAANRGLMLNYNLGNSGLIDASWNIINLDSTMKVNYVSIAVSGNGDSDPTSNVYISYQDHDNDNIYFKRKNVISSSVGGGSIYTTGNNSDSSIAIGPEAGVNTNVFIVWLNGNDPYNVVFARSTDNGAIWEWRDSGNWATVDPTAALPTDAKVATGTYTEKAVNISAQDNNNLYVSYTDSGQKLQLLKSTTGGESWSLPIEAANNVSYVNNMTITGTGATTKIYISYYGGSVSDLGLAYSDDNGTTWYQHITTTCVNDAKLNDITVSDDKVYIIADGDSGVNQVMCCKVEIS